MDSHPQARGGFGAEKADYALGVDFIRELEAQIDKDKRAALRGVLSQDPRPSYQADPERVYGVRFAQYNVKFTVSDGMLHVVGVEKSNEKQ